MIERDSTIYASVDLELTGFDPATDEVVEIGIVLFEAQSGKITVVKEWQSLIKPQGSFHARIQGLTGISELDLQNAPTKDMVLDEVRTLLQGVTLVGHGVSLDRKFLEQFGVHMQAEEVDTLELAQIFLPTYHSYNLENLSHAFSVAHTAAHRALSDAQATVGVLRGMVGIFWSLPEEVRNRVLRVAQLRKYAWVNLFLATGSETLPPAGVQGPVIESQVGITNDTLPILRSASQVLPVESALAVPWKALNADTESWVVVLAGREQVLDAARMGYATPFLGVAEAVSVTALAQAEAMVEELHEREVLALLKIIVWQVTTTSAVPLLAEINWSLVGTDFKKRFSEIRPFPQTAGVIAVDYRSLPGVPVGKSIYICETDKYLSWLEQQSGYVVSWQGIIHQLRQIYNPENGYGDASKAEAVQEAIAVTDLFYASVLLLLKKHNHCTQGVIAETDISPYAVNRIGLAGQHYLARLRGLVDLESDKNFSRILQSLHIFFESDASTDELRWVEIAVDRCVFVSRPLHLEATQQSVLRGARRVVYTTDVQGPDCVAYLADRVAMGHPPDIVSRPIQQVSSPKVEVVSYQQESDRSVALRELLANKQLYLVFPSQNLLKAYYDAQYGSFANKQAIIAVGIHGGVNKVLRNFVFSSKSVVFIAQSALAGFGAVRLHTDDLVFVGAPLVDFDHPFTIALLKKYFLTEQGGQRVLQALALAQSIRPFALNEMQGNLHFYVLESERVDVENILNVLLQPSV